MDFCIPQKALTLSWKVEECTPLVHGVELPIPVTHASDVNFLPGKLSLCAHGHGHFI